MRAAAARPVSRQAEEGGRCGEGGYLGRDVPRCMPPIARAVPALDLPATCHTQGVSEGTIKTDPRRPTEGRPSQTCIERKRPDVAVTLHARAVGGDDGSAVRWVGGAEAVTEAEARRRRRVDTSMVMCQNRGEQQQGTIRATKRSALR